VSRRKRRRQQAAASRAELRFATGDDLPAVRELAQLAGSPLPEEMAAAITDGSAGSALRKGLAEGRDAFTWEVARLAAESENLADAFPALSVVLVAEHGEHGVIGALTANPPGAMMRSLYDAFGRDELMLGCMGYIGKVAAVAAVPAWRGAGAGSALLGQCVSIYTRLGFELVYGYMRADADLGGFYRRNGFDVFGPGEYLDLWPVLGVHAKAVENQGERPFARWTGALADGPGPAEMSRRVADAPAEDGRAFAFAAAYRCGHCGGRARPGGGGAVETVHEPGCPVLTGAAQAGPDQMRAAARAVQEEAARDLRAWQRRTPGVEDAAASARPAITRIVAAFYAAAPGVQPCDHLKAMTFPGGKAGVMPQRGAWFPHRPGRVYCAECTVAVADEMAGTLEDFRCDCCGKAEMGVPLYAGQGLEQMPLPFADGVTMPVMVSYGLCLDCHSGKIPPDG